MKFYFRSLLFISAVVVIFATTHISLYPSTVSVETNQPQPKERKGKTFVIPIEGEIAPAVYTYLQRAVSEATNQNATKVIFKINTFGGRVDTTYEIVDLILTINAETVSVVDEKAISAGTLIALASRSLYMIKNSTLGDVAPIMMGQEGPKMLGEKFQSPLRAKFRSLAQRNGYPEKLSESFVSDHIEILEVTWKDDRKEILTGVEYKDLSESERKKVVKKRTVVKKGELLTLSDFEAKQLGFSTATISKLDDVLSSNEEVIYMEVNSSEKLLSILNKYAFLIILIGLGGIYLEVKNPGFGFYGIVAIIAFGIFFLSHYIVELANYIELILLLAGIILIVLEIFVFPGFGIFGITGITVLLISLVLMMQKFTIPIEEYEWNLFSENLYTVMLSFLISTGLFVVVLIFSPKVFKRSPIVLKNVNSSDSDINSFEKRSSQSPSQSNYFSSNIIEKEGVAYTDLRPSGLIKVEEKIYDASSGGDFISKGTAVIVDSYRTGSYFVSKK